MPEPQYRIHSDQDDVIAYSEGESAGEDRLVEFARIAGVEPPQVTVPDRHYWREQTPAWAHERRNLIVERLCEAGAIVREWGGELTTVQAPDGSLRVESRVVPDERAAAWESTQVIAQPGGKVLANLTLHAVSGAIMFPAPGCVELQLQGRYGSRHQLRIDAGTQSFELDGAPARPLDQLEALLYPPHAEVPIAVVKPPNVLVEGASTIGSLIFVAGGLWMALTAATLKDRWIGLGCALFFGLCAAVFIVDWRRGRAARKARPPAR